MLAITIILGVIAVCEVAGAIIHFSYKKHYMDSIDALQPANARLSKEIDMWRDNCLNLTSELIALKRQNQSSDEKEEEEK